MKKVYLIIVVVSFLLAGVNAFAEDGDLIVDGKVGVGTTNLISKMTINISDEGTTMGICVNGANEGLHLRNSANNVEYGSLKSNSTGNGSVRLTTPDANKTLILQENGGNVGIGTTTPAYKLEVNGTIRASSGIAVYQVTANGCKATSALTLSSTCSTKWCGNDGDHDLYYSCESDLSCNSGNPYVSQTCNNTFVGRLITP